MTHKASKTFGSFWYNRVSDLVENSVKLKVQFSKPIVAKYSKEKEDLNSGLAF